MCVLSHFRTCDVRAEVRAERVWNCACGSACVWAIFQLAICDCTFLLMMYLKGETFKYIVPGFQKKGGKRNRIAFIVNGSLVHFSLTMYN